MSAEPAEVDHECTAEPGRRFVLQPERIEYGVHCKRHGYSHPMHSQGIANRHRTEGFGAGCPDAHIVTRVVKFGPWVPLDGRVRR